MKIIKLTAENVKRLKAVEITPTGALVQITGPNGSGKTSVLDAIYWALAGGKAIDSKPIRTGEEQARITLDLGELTVTRKFNASGTTSLAVEQPNGAVFRSPQAMLDKLLGSLTFDPLAFARSDPKGQLEQLRKLVPLAIDIDALDFDQRRDYEARTELNRQAKALAAQVEAITVDDAVEPVDVAALLAQMEAASTTNSHLQDEREYRKREERDITDAAVIAASKRQAAARLIAEADEVERIAADHRRALDAMPPITADVDVAALSGQINQAWAVNERVKLRDSRRALVTQHAGLLAELDQLNARMDTRASERRQAISSAAMPVEGLGFGEGEVTFNGVPFAQASGAEQLRVSVAIAMAGNPQLRVLRIKDGSLLDDANLALLEQMAEAADYQVWIERVETDGTVGIVMEDGAVAGAPTAA